MRAKAKTKAPNPSKAIKEVCSAFHEMHRPYMRRALKRAWELRDTIGYGAEVAKPFEYRGIVIPLLEHTGVYVFTGKVTKVSRATFKT